MQIKQMKTLNDNKVMNAPRSLVKAILPKFSKTATTADDVEADTAGATDVDAGRV